MTGVNFAALIRNYTHTNSTTFPDSEMVLLANTVKDDFAPAIKKANEDFFGVIATRNLVASSSSDMTKREYTLPEDTLGIKYLEAKFDGTNWVVLSKFDLNKYRRPTDEATIIGQFANEKDRAFYDIFRRSIWIYSGTISAVTSGLKLHHIAYPADIEAGDLADIVDLSTDPSATTSQLPRQFHELWARKVSILWKSGRQQPVPLNERELKFEDDFKDKIAEVRKADEDEEVTSSTPYNDGSQY